MEYETLDTQPTEHEEMRLAIRKVRRTRDNRNFHKGKGLTLITAKMYPQRITASLALPSLSMVKRKSSATAIMPPRS